jgi:hypothetical protein
MRVKNRVEKTFQDLSPWEQRIAALTGRKGLEAGKMLWASTDLKEAMRILNHPTGPNKKLQASFTKQGWKVLLATKPDDETAARFHFRATRGLLAIMDAISEAIDTGRAEQIRQFADALEIANPSTPADPLASYLLSLSAGSTKKGTLKQVRFPQAREIQQWLLAASKTSLDLKTIRRRASALGLKLGKGQRGAPKGKPHKMVVRSRR